MNDWTQIFALFIMSAGTAALIAALVLMNRLRSRKSDDTEAFQATMGTVVDFENHGPADDEVWHPVVEFTASDGRVHQGATDWGANPMPFLMGSSIPIRYDPGHPSRRIRYAGPRPRSGEPTAGAVRGLLITGAIVFVLGLAGWLYTVYG